MYAYIIVAGILGIVLTGAFFLWRARSCTGTSRSGTSAHRTRWSRHDDRLTTTVVPTARRRPARQRKRCRLGRMLRHAVWLPLALIALWWFVTANSTRRSSRRSATSWSTPGTSGLSSGPGRTRSSSLRNLFIGYIFGAVLGHRRRLAPVAPAVSADRDQPNHIFLYVLPAPALLPAMIAIFGIGDMRQIALIALGSDLADTAEHPRRHARGRHGEVRHRQGASPRRLAHVLLSCSRAPVLRSRPVCAPASRSRSC